MTSAGPLHTRHRKPHPQSSPAHAAGGGGGAADRSELFFNKMKQNPSTDHSALRSSRRRTNRLAGPSSSKRKLPDVHYCPDSFSVVRRARFSVRKSDEHPPKIPHQHNPLTKTNQYKYVASKAFAPNKIAHGTSPSLLRLATTSPTTANTVPAMGAVSPPKRSSSKFCITNPATGTAAQSSEPTVNAYSQRERRGSRDGVR